LKLKNTSQAFVGYKFKTNAPLRYSVKPVLGVLAAGQSVEVFVRCESWVNPHDRFLLQTVSLTEAESEHIDAVTWKDLDRRRIVENFIPCLSSSTLAMRDPQDDGGALSSSSSSNGNGSSRRSADRERHSRHPHTTPPTSHPSSKAHPVHVQKKVGDPRQPPSTSLESGRRLSTSSTGSATSAVGNAYPTLFSSSPLKSSAPPARGRSSLSKETRFSSSGVSGERGGTRAGVTGSGEKSTMLSYMSTKVSNSRQTIRTVTRFLAVRQYTKMQVFTVSVICLLLGLLLPLEKVFLLVGGNNGASNGAGLGGHGHEMNDILGNGASSMDSMTSSLPIKRLPIVVTTGQQHSNAKLRRTGTGTVVAAAASTVPDDTPNPESVPNQDSVVEAMAADQILEEPSVDPWFVPETPESMEGVVAEGHQDS
ncbi:hypothetical protein BGW38_005721, partial [Lunasporangiospora selenospora]